MEQASNLGRLVRISVRRAASRAFGLVVAGLSLASAIAVAQAQPQTPERSVPAVRRIPPAGRKAPAADVLPAVIVVRGEDVAALASRLQEFGGGLSSAEREAFDRLLSRAAAAPPDSSEGANVKLRLFTAGLRREGEAEPAGIIVQGGRGQSSGGGIKSSPIAVLREMLGPGNVSIGPKQDDPRAPSASTGALAIGPKQDDPGSPSSSLAGKMQAFGDGLSVTERAMLDWLLQRAASSPLPAHGSPDGPRPSPEQTLRAALGIEAIGPKQDDPSPRPDARRWTLRF